MSERSDHVASASHLVDRVLAWVRESDNPAWAVGGYVRDRLLGRPANDLDIVVPAGGVRLARAIAGAFGGASFVLDADRDVGRTVLRTEDGHPVEVDVARLREPTLLGDLTLRDFTVNAIAMDLDAVAPEPRVFDPFDGRLDLTRNLLRAVTENAFRDDPLRMLRGVRLAAELDFELEGATVDLIKRDALLLPRVSPERIRDELVRIVSARAGWQYIRQLAQLGLLEPVLPECAAQVGLTQSPPHYQDVFDHSRSVVAHTEGILAVLWPDQFAPPAEWAGDTTRVASASRWSDLADLLAPQSDALREHLLRPLAGGRPRRDLLLLAALAHDWGKPATLGFAPDRRRTFYGHEEEGSRLVARRAGALRLSAAETDYLALVVAQHMRPTHLAKEFPASRRAVFRFYRDAGEAGPDITLLSLADHCATRAAAPDEASWLRRVGTTRILLDAFFFEGNVMVAPAPLVDGTRLMSLLDLRPGPRVGALLAKLLEAQATGEVTTPDEAVSWLRNHAQDEGEPA